MENSSIEFTLPPAPRGLCFDRNDFVKTNFSVDSFLAEHQNVASLETMRDDLGIYLKVLRLAMIELINKDYANFVNLSATLIGFDKVIINIQTPLEKLHEEVESVKQCLEDAMRELSMWLSQRHGLQKKKQLLKYYSQTVNCLNTLEDILKNITNHSPLDQIALADRAVMQYNQLKFSISKCESIVKNEQKLLFNDISGNLTQTLNSLFFKFWKNNDEVNLLKTLITITSLGRITETEMLIRKQGIAPLLQDIINETYLQKSKGGLKEIYDKVLRLLEIELKLLHSVMQHSKLSFNTKKLNFLINCFWCEVESRIEVNLASIFAPGNPKVFYRRYSESMEFVKRIESYCTENENVTILHNTAEYKSFLKRWNLPVYFQIRFQEIAGGFESGLGPEPTLENGEEFLLKESVLCWNAVLSCWKDGIYIEALTHKFWKLSLQLLSRYGSWTKAYCTQKKATQTFEVTCINKELLNNSISIYTDTQTLLQRIPQFLQLVENKVCIENKDVFCLSIKSTEDSLLTTNKTIRDCIVNELFEYFNIQLKQVSDIPRLYRKTNRSVPTKPCSYIDVVSKEMVNFNEESSSKLDNSFRVEIFEELFNVMTSAYYKYVDDVLTSVHKTEESLRRLKQIRDSSAQQSKDSLGVTDGDKIRLQVKMDVVSYGKLAEGVGVDVHNVHKYKELTYMINEVVKNVDIK